MKCTETIGTVEFPEPTGVHANMMPFIMGDPDSIPESLMGYRSLVDSCNLETAELDQVGYLTVMETAVTPSDSQRRGGVHTERHPAASWGGGGWGAGKYNNRRQGGIYLASTMAGTTGLWDIETDSCGPGGDCEHLRDQLGQSRLLDANELVWFTDAVPHESLSPQQSSVRQFFRLVTSAVDLWYVDHSTPNPFGVAPPSHVQLVCGNKFEA